MCWCAVKKLLSHSLTQDQNCGWHNRDHILLAWNHIAGYSCGKLDMTSYYCVGIGTDVPDRAADAVQPDGFYDGHVEQGLKDHSDAVNPSPQSQPPRPLQMNIGAGNHPFPKSFLDGDFEFVRWCFCGFSMTNYYGKVMESEIS